MGKVQEEMTTKFKHPVFCGMRNPLKARNGCFLNLICYQAGERIVTCGEYPYKRNKVWT